MWCYTHYIGYNNVIKDNSSLGNTNLSDAPTCSEDFFSDENEMELCRPICGEFIHKLYAIEILELASACLALVNCAIMIVWSFTVQKKIM